MQPPDPISRANLSEMGGLESAARVATVRWLSVVNDFHRLECKGISYVSV